MKFNYCFNLKQDLNIFFVFSANKFFQIQFIMKHEFRSTTAAALQSESKEPEIVWLEHKVYINLGPV